MHGIVCVAQIKPNETSIMSLKLAKWAKNGEKREMKTVTKISQQTHFFCLAHFVLNYMVDARASDSIHDLHKTRQL